MILYSKINHELNKSVTPRHFSYSFKTKCVQYQHVNFKVDHSIIILYKFFGSKVQSPKLGQRPRLGHPGTRVLDFELSLCEDGYMNMNVSFDNDSYLFLEPWRGVHIHFDIDTPLASPSPLPGVG